MRTYVQKPEAAKKTTTSKSMGLGQARSGQSRAVSSIQSATGNQGAQRLLQARAEGLEVSSGRNTSAEFIYDFSRVPVHARVLNNIQPKLEVNAPGDIYEQEADRVADQVMRVPEQPTLYKLRSHQNFNTELQQSNTRFSSNRLPVRASVVRPVLESRIPALWGQGQPLPQSERAFFEPRFGMDFSTVHIHNGSKADVAAKQISARAFTFGSDIAFAAGQFKPGTPGGRRLIAHELTHVLQQSDSAAAAPNRTPVSGGTNGTVAEDTGSMARRPLNVNLGRSTQVVQREAMDVAEQRDLRRRIHQLSDDELIALLEALYRQSPDGRGRTGSGTADDPYENYAEYLRRSRSLVTTPGVLSPNPVLGLLAPPRLMTPDPIESLGVQPGLMESRADAVARLIPLAEAAARARLRAISGDRPGAHLFDRGHRESWPNALPTAPTPALNNLQRQAIEAVQRRLEAVEIPTATNHLRRAGRGHDYIARRDGAPEHRAYAFRGDEELGLASSRRDQRAWEIFEFVMRSEGDTSALNTYDSQIVTVGAGFSARSRRAQALYNRLPEAFRRTLFEHGIQVNDDNTFTVLDLTQGIAVSGDGGLRLLQRDERRLSLLINLAQSEEQMTMEGETRPAREWMLEAQFEQIRDGLPRAVVDTWPLAAAKIAVKIRHWQPGVVSWADLSRWSTAGTDVSAMLRGARDAIWDFHRQPAHGAFSLDAVERRFRRRARQAGAGRITFTPRPTR